MRRLLDLIGASLGGWLGWWLGAKVGIMTGFMLSVVGMGFGIYLARRFLRAALG
ncbi:MAG: hypothetical protein ACE5HB_04775 [Terriglobia bacterium]